MGVIFKELDKKVSDACCVASLLDFHIQIKCHIEMIHYNWICFWIQWINIKKKAGLDLNRWNNAFENLGDPKDFLTTY